jgi:hypothetical protein
MVWQQAARGRRFPLAAIPTQGDLTRVALLALLTQEPVVMWIGALTAAAVMSIAPVLALAQTQNTN